MDKSEYSVKCEVLLQDISVYQHLSKDMFPIIHRELIKTLCNFKNNNLSLKHNILCRLHGSTSHAARFYGLPKIHKNDMLMCPMGSACGTTTYNTAKFLTKMHQNFCNMISSLVKDSKDFIHKIKNLPMNPEETYFHLMSVLFSPAYQ